MPAYLTNTRCLHLAETWTSVRPGAEVLARLGPRDLASLAGAGRACAAAVAATALMQRAKDETDLPPRPRSTFPYCYPTRRWYARVMF